MNTTTPSVIEQSVLAEPELELGWVSSARAVRHLVARRPEGQPVLSVRATISEGDTGSFIAKALQDIRVYMQEHHVQPVGPPFSICRSRGNEIDIEAGWPLAEPAVGTGRIHGGAIPISLLEPETGRRMT